MTVGENISYGAPNEVTTEQIIEAAKKANAYKFIKEFPDGLDTMVGERGQMLSGPYFISDKNKCLWFFGLNLTTFWPTLL